MAMLRRFVHTALLCAIIFIGLYFDNDRQNQRERPLTNLPYAQQMAESEAVLEGQDLASLQENLSLHLTYSNRFLSERSIDAMLRQFDHLDHPIVYRSNLSNHQPYTMSALGIDNRHHLANVYLEGYAPFTVENVMIPLYVLAQRKSYQLDSKHYWGKEDVWQSSRQAFYYSRGDCEDHAIILADWLITLGEDARVVVGNWGGEGHAWVILFKDGIEYLLEATRKSGLGRNRPYPLAALHPEYHPEYMFDQSGFWVNNGSVYTTNYSGKHWQKQSTVWIKE